MFETKKEILEHQKEMERRAGLSNQERAKLTKEDDVRNFKKRLERVAKVDGRIKERDKAALEIENGITELAGKIKKFVTKDIETYHMLLNPDCLFSDCPISDQFTYNWIKQFMIKCDMDFIGIALDGKPSLKTFVERSTEASRWAMRFTKEIEAKKTGLEAIL